MISMADKAISENPFFSSLRVELDRFINFLNDTWHNYERPVKRGFFCPDTSIRYPYSPDDTVSIPVLLCIVTLPFLMMTWHGIISYWMLKRDSTFQRPHPMGMVVGAFLTALLTACIKLGVGQLAPNFYEGCQPDVKCWNGNLNFHSEFTCYFPDRLREVSRSFPCMYTSLSSFTWSYLLIYCLYNSSSRFLRTATIVTFLAPPTTIALTRLHDHRSHPCDVIAGCMLGIFLAAISAVEGKAASSCQSDRKSLPSTDDDESYEKIKEGMLKPTVRVCSSALYCNVEGFVEELVKRSHGFVEGVEFSELPFNDLDAFNLDGWHKNDITILCHSIDNRRLSLTDVTDALYDKFIPKASKLCGKDSLIVIAHDFKWTSDQAKARQDLETTLGAKQPTVYKYAGKVILAGKLSDEKKINVGLRDQEWDDILDVISNWSKRRR